MIMKLNENYDYFIISVDNVTEALQYLQQLSAFSRYVSQDFAISDDNIMKDIKLYFQSSKEFIKGSVRFSVTPGHPYFIDDEDNHRIISVKLIWGLRENDNLRKKFIELDIEKDAHEKLKKASIEDSNKTLCKDESNSDQCKDPISEIPTATEAYIEANKYRLVGELLEIYKNSIKDAIDRGEYIVSINLDTATYSNDIIDACNRILELKEYTMSTKYHVDVNTDQYIREIIIDWGYF